MKTKKPIKSNSTSKLLKSVLPGSFKMVNDPSSNGYKFINLLYGVESDLARDLIDEAYHNLFLSTINLNQINELYEVTISGIRGDVPNLSGDGLPIKIVDTYEFYNGTPTRLEFDSSIYLPGIGSNIIGLEYIRVNDEGSGYLLITKDSDLETLYNNSEGTVNKYEIDRIGNPISYSGTYVGIRDQNYDETNRDEIVYPLLEGDLKRLYPDKRDITISGIIYSIDHYEPYKGWLKDQEGNIVADTREYPGSYYYDSEDKKVYYKTSRNNPYGDLNYGTTAFVPLEHIPISGTLHVYDIDILDDNGVAIEIPQSGINLYFFQASGLFAGLEKDYESAYLGYNQFVPYGRGFVSEGEEAVYLKTVSWDYIHDDSILNPETNVFDEVSSGNLTNILKINYANGRYMVEYKYKEYNKLKCITSIESTKYIRKHSYNPQYTIENIAENLTETSYEFSKDPLLEKQLITFNGLEIRPGSLVSQIDVRAPVIFSSYSDLNEVTNEIDRDSIGFSDKHAPIIDNRIYYIKTNFSSDNLLIEEDSSGNDNDLIFYGSGEYRLNLINNNDNYAKRIINTEGETYYYSSYSGVYFNDMFFNFNFYLESLNEITLMEYWNAERYINLSIKEDGQVILNSNYTQYKSYERLESQKDYGLIIRHFYNDQYGTLGYDFYLRADNFYYEKLNIARIETSNANDDSTIPFIHVFKNGSIRAKKFEFYTENINRTENEYLL